MPKKKILNRIDLAGCWASRAIGHGPSAVCWLPGWEIVVLTQMEPVKLCLVINRFHLGSISGAVGPLGIVWEILD